MKSPFADLKRIFYQYILLLAIYSICRSGFLLLNIQNFNHLDLSILLKLFFWGFRYDVSAIMMLNGLYGLLFLMPFSFFKRPEIRSFLHVYFIISNALALLFEIGDWVYFPYNFKRSTASLFDLIFRKGDFINLLPSWLIQYWYLPLLAVMIIYLMIRINNKIIKGSDKWTENNSFNRQLNYLSGSFSLVLFALISLLGMRGGFQYIPIGIRNAVQTAGVEYAPVVLNTPFSILTSFAAEPVQEIHYMTEKQADEIIQPIKHYKDKTFLNKNVVFILLESFSKEFTSLGDGLSYTPFLDSLMSQSLVCSNAFSNALRSAEGIPAILAGIPSLMDEPIHTSPFGANRISGLPAILKTKGYNASFFHGGTNGTMAFDGFAPAAGFDQYYGRDEYNNEKDHDGNWGIWDEPFLQYAEKKINTQQTPFIASIFTLTSHPPYNIPKKYRNKIPEGKIPIHKCIRYTDNALKMFFENASKEKWFNNTLFVITADHASPASEGGYWSSPIGRYAIPIVYFAPGDSTLKGIYKGITQQIDILPSILDYLGYEKPFFAIGNSIFRENYLQKAVINQVNGTYTIFNDEYILTAQEISPLSLYDRRKDSLCKKNILQLNKHHLLLPQLKSTIQVFRNSLVQNKLWVRIP